MALVLADRVQQTGTANTTVSFTLSGSVTGYQSFAVVGNTNTTYYAATDTSGNWEVGIGTYSTTGPTLTRTTVVASSNSGSAVTFSGTVNVFVTYPSEKSVNLDGSGNVSALGTVSSGVWQGTAVAVGYGGTGATSAGIGAFNNITGYTASGATGTTSTNLVFSTSPTLTTPNIGAATATSINIGTLTYTPANSLISSQSSASTYNQIILQNSNTGSTASADFIVNNSNSTDSTYYGDFGMNSSGFTGSGAFNQANYVYLTSTSTDLAIGTTTSNSIHFVVNNGATDAMTIATTGAVTANTSVTSPVVTVSNGIVVNSKTVSASYTIPSGSSAMSAGPMTVASGQSVTISSGSRWVIL